MTAPPTFSWIMFLCAAFVLGLAVGHSLQDVSWHKDAVAHKAAEYYLDEKNERQWRWIDPIK